MDKSFHDGASSLWAGNSLSGRSHACGSAEFLIPCCSDRGFIHLGVQDSKGEFLSSSYYKDLHRDRHEGGQESRLSVTAEHSTPPVLPSQPSKYCKNAGVMSYTSPAEAADMQEPHMCSSTSTKGNCSNKHHVVQSSSNG